jgi:hypothetical protein
MLGQPLFMLTRRSSAVEALGRAAARASPPPTWCSPSRSFCARRASSTSSSSSTGPAMSHMPLPTAPPSPTWRPSTARPGLLPGRRKLTLEYLRTHNGRPAEVVAPCEATTRRRALPHRRHRRPDLHRHRRAGPGHRRAQPGRPQAPARPRPLLGMKSFPQGAGRRRSKTAASASPSRPGQDRHHRHRPRRDRGDRPRRGPHRGHHELHQHLEPLGDARRGPAGAEGRREGPHGRPAVKTSLAPGSRVVTDYLTASRARSRPSRSSASTWSATAAPPASATADRCPTRSRPARHTRPGRLRGDLGQPQLRGPRAPAGEGQLPGLAAARGRLRASPAPSTATSPPSPSAPAATASPSS